MAPECEILEIVELRTAELIKSDDARIGAGIRKMAVALLANGVETVDAALLRGEDGSESITLFPVGELAKAFDQSTGGGVERKNVPDANHAGPNRTFPVVIPQDVADHAKAMTAIKDPQARAAAQAKLKAIATKLGPTFTARLPAALAKAAGDAKSCPTCDGTGKIQANTTRCPTCAGAGVATPAQLAKALENVQPFLKMAKAAYAGDKIISAQIKTAQDAVHAAVQAQTVDPDVSDDDDQKVLAALKTAAEVLNQAATLHAQDVASDATSTQPLDKAGASCPGCKGSGKRSGGKCSMCDGTGSVDNSGSAGEGGTGPIGGLPGQ